MPADTSTRPRSVRSRRLESFLTDILRALPWRIVFTDWEGATYACGGDRAHWCGEDLRVSLHTEAAGRDLMRVDGLAFLDRFLLGEADLEGNLYILANIRKHTKMGLKFLRFLPTLLKNFAFQSTRSAKVNVKSHYDVPQEALNAYLDTKYMSYSCGIWERPDDFRPDDFLTVGKGEEDTFDSLEKSQWRKFKDAADFIAPKEGEELLDVGCGYGGQLAVALESHPFGKVVGWTHSANQVREGRKLLAHLDASRYELHEGDYREDERVFDHITSTGMISHVGPRGLVPYVRNVRKRIKTGGRYLHHSLMTHYNPLPLNFNVGVVFNKKYVWPGFHWFTLGEHVRALERNGFQIVRVRSLTRHYAKTTAAWYARMMDQREHMVQTLGEATFRAWRIFLAGITGSYQNKQTHVYRLYCEAV